MENMKKFFNRLYLNLVSSLRLTKENNDGMGIIEIVLIILVLVGLVVIFKTQITSILNSIFTKVSKTINSF